MSDPVKTNHELIEEISFLKQRIQDLEKSEAECKRAESQREAALEAQQRDIIGRNVIEWTADYEKEKNAGGGGVFSAVWRS